MITEWTIDRGATTISIDDITKLREKAKKPPPPPTDKTTSIIRPVRMEAGEEVFALVLNPYQITGLKTETGTGSKWREIAAQADPRGSTNRLWTGVVGKYDGVMIYESIYLPYDATTSSERSYGLFLGAQAGHVAFGNPYSRLTRPRDRGPVRELFSYFEDVRDYGNRTGTGGASIFGMSRALYDAVDYGLQVLITGDKAST